MFRFGRVIDNIKGNSHNYYANRLVSRYRIVKNVTDTLNATFAFDFLMACIGVVAILLVAILL